VVEEKQYFINYWGRLRDICQGPDGEIYLATNGPNWQNTDPFTHRIIKVWNPDFTDIQETSNNNAIHFKVYPNPATDFIYVRTDKAMVGTKFSIISSYGAVVYSTSISQTDITIAVDHINSGVYQALVISDEGVVYSEKLLIY
jgi:hypothetical protein